MISAQQLRNEAYAAYQAGDAAAAERLCKESLALDRRQAEALYLLGVIHSGRGEIDEAVKRIESAIQIAPNNAVFLNALGEILQGRGDRSGAEKLFQRAIHAAPTYARAHNSLGLIQFANGQVRAAIPSFQRAIQIDPRYATAQNNLGAAWQRLGDLSTARQHFLLAIAAREAYPEAHFNLATTYYAQGELTVALTHVRRAITLRNDYARALSLEGQILVSLGKVEAARESFERSIAADASDADTHLRLANIFRLLNRLDEARREYERALALRPDDRFAFAGFFRVKEELCDWQNRQADLERLTRDVREEIAAGRPSPLTPLHAASFPFSGAELLAIAKSETRAHRPAATPPVWHSALHRIPRIGYLSRDLYDHPVAHQVYRIFALHDRDKFEVHVYSTGPNDASRYRQGIAASVECFHDVADLSSKALFERIASDEIDILVDLMGHTGMNRMDCLAMRPAPIAMTWLGYPGTTGMPFIDYLIGDRVVTPSWAEADYSEKIIRLPHCFMPTDDAQAISARPIGRAEMGLAEEGTVFCCFNNAFKIDPETFESWLHIAQAVPGSQLWLSVRDESARENLRRAAASGGIDPSRLVFAGFVRDKEDHLARLRLADLFLDTQFYNAHATACDALWAGLPVLTLPGRTFASRVAASLVSAANMPELVAQTREEYRERAISLVSGEIAEIQQKLREGVRISPLFDTARFVKNLEKAFEIAWQRHLRSEPPSAMEVEG